MTDFTFELTAEMRARLRGLAESCRTEGTGTLASANYHGQGRVHVPAQWLLEILGPEVDQFVVVLEERAYESGLGFEGNEPSSYALTVERAARLSSLTGFPMRVEHYVPW